MKYEIKDGMLIVSSGGEYVPDPISKHIERHIEELHKVHTCSIRLALKACKRAAAEAFCKECSLCGCTPEMVDTCVELNAFVAEYERQIRWSESEMKEISDSYERDKI